MEVFVVVSVTLFLWDRVDSPVPKPQPGNVTKALAGHCSWYGEGALDVEELEVSCKLETLADDDSAVMHN